jgi:hypothetical protein
MVASYVAGMLKNMAIHELALLVSFFDVTVENIAECIPDKEFSSCQTLNGPGGKDFTDFDKIKFTIKTKTGKEVSVQADRCGGNTSYAKVDKDEVEVFRHEMPDEEDMANVAALEKEYPGAMVRKQIRWLSSGSLAFLSCSYCVVTSRSRTSSSKIQTTSP